MKIVSIRKSRGRRRYARPRIRCSVTERESHTAPACDSGVVGGRAQGLAHHHLECLQPTGSALPELRERVLATAKRLGYAGPDPVARSLRTRKAGAVGLVMTEATDLLLQRPGGAGFRCGSGAIVRRAGAGAAAGGRRTQPQPCGRDRRRAFAPEWTASWCIRSATTIPTCRWCCSGGCPSWWSTSPIGLSGSVAGGHRRPGGDARARRLRAGAGASRDRAADHATGPGPTPRPGGRRTAAVADLRRAARTHHRRLGGDDGRRSRPGFADRGGKLRAPADVGWRRRQGGAGR